MKKPKVNKEICIACGTCFDVCPDVFENGSDGKAQVKDADYEELEECVQGAIDACPVSAIFWEEEDNDKKEKDDSKK